MINGTIAFSAPLSEKIIWTLKKEIIEEILSKYYIPNSKLGDEIIEVILQVDKGLKSEKCNKR